MLPKEALRRHRLAKKGVTARLGVLEEEQWYPPERMVAVQRERLGTLLLYAYAHVPYYHRLLAESGTIGPGGDADLGSFTRIPLLDKSAIQANFTALTVDDLAQHVWWYAASGGSTGAPVRVIQEKDRLATEALPLLFDAWAGYTPGMRQIRFWGNIRDVFGRRASKERLGIRIKRWLNNELVLNSYRVTADRMRAYADRVNAFKPDYITGYTDFIYYLARFIEREGLAVHAPHALSVGATPLYPHMRAAIERVFQAPVFDCYGAHETYVIAAECAYHRGLHVSASTHYLEILRPDGSPAAPGEIGELVVTPLVNRTMPLIRYRLEDLGAWAPEPCPCGRGWPLIGGIIGRVIDVFIKKNGEMVSSGYPFTIIELVNYKHGGFIDKFQIIQEDYGHIRIPIVPLAEVGDPRARYARALDEIATKIRRIMDEGCRVEFEFPAEIAPSASGKYRVTVNKIKREPGEFGSIFKPGEDGLDE